MLSFIIPPFSISIHASLAGGDELKKTRNGERKHFNPRLPCGRRPQPLRGQAQTRPRFQSTPPLREATRKDLFNKRAYCNFNPRLPCGRRRGVNGYNILAGLYFNPRLPCGRRRSLSSVLGRQRHFNPRLPCGRRQSAMRITELPVFISIHASLAGGDDFRDFPPYTTAISIHASLAGGDWSLSSVLGRQRHFNPRLPCGRRHQLTGKSLAELSFQSTPPLREATAQLYKTCRANPDFNPRLPCGRRLGGKWL